MEWGIRVVDFKTKQPCDSNAEVCLYKDLQAIADDDPSTPRGKIYVIQDARSALEKTPGAPERLKRELLRLQTHFGGDAAILLVAKEGINFPAFSDLIKTFPCPPLASDEVKAILSAFQVENKILMDSAIENKLISTCPGMEEYMVLQVLKSLKNNHGQSFDKKAVDDAVNQKKSFLSQSGLLELIDVPINMAAIGGLGRFKRWLRDKKKPIMDDLSQAQEYGIAAPKGVLLAGMPGCGKSMSAKAAASLFNVPLLRLDVGSVMGKFVGESEANMKAALQVAETASPCVLWIDELEKAFAGVNSSGGSTEISTRLFGYFLTWMQEKPGAVFVVATVNDLSSTPSELLRRGRFDEIFYIDLPAEFEREEIFELKIKGLSTKSKAAVNVSQDLDFAALAEKSEGFSGADIEQVIQGALTDLFLRRNSSEENRELAQADLARHIQSTTPMSETLKEKIEKYRKNFEGYKLENASFSEEEYGELSFNVAHRQEPDWPLGLSYSAQISARYKANGSWQGFNSGDQLSQAPRPAVQLPTPMSPRHFRSTGRLLIPGRKLNTPDNWRDVPRAKG